MEHFAHTQSAFTFALLELPTSLKEEKDSNSVNFLPLFSSSIRFLVVSMIMYELLNPSVFLPYPPSVSFFIFFLGYRVFSDCHGSNQTQCTKCLRGEYQPGWTQEKRCLQQKFCDPGQYLRHQKWPRCSLFVLKSALIITENAAVSVNHFDDVNSHFFPGKCPLHGLVKLELHQYVFFISVISKSL